MPNLMLTNWCNYKCPYCFGMDRMVPKEKAQAMSDETLLGILDWLDKCQPKETIHLMGGEPTLHPRFEWIVNTLLEREYRIVVFSNLATERAAEYADKLAMFPTIEWVVNVNPPSKWTPVQRERIEKALATLGPRASITFNIMPNEEDDDWAIELTNRFNLSRRIKVGFVLPTITQVNYSLADEDYSTVAAKTVRLAEIGAPQGIQLQYECGIPSCAFTDEQLGRLWRAGSRLHSGCCSRLDITPQGELIYCLPMSTVASPHFSEFNTYLEAKEWFETKFAPLRQFGRTLECQSCALFNPAKCNGACLAKNLTGVKNLKIR